MSIRVQLSCKHKVIAEGIAAVLRTHADIHLVGVSDEDLGTKILCELERPEVVVVGVDPRRSDDVALTRWVSQLTPRPEIVAFSTDCDCGSVLQMMQAGATSFVSTQSSMDDSRPGPGPLISTSRFLMPCSWAARPATSEATWAANGVDLREPLKPWPPEEAHDRALP